jgi:Transposase DDE domain
MARSPNVLDFRSPDTTHRPGIEALELIGRYAAAGNLSYTRPVSTSRLTRGRAGTGNPAAAAATRCGHDVRPNLITGVATTRASVADAEMTTLVNAALARRDLAPGRHYLDAGYGSARNVLDAARQFGITLVTLLPADSSRQARAGDGYDRTAFAIDYDARTVTCPQGKPSTGWTPVRQEGRDAIVVRFGITTCRPCPARQLCTKPPATAGS